MGRAKRNRSSVTNTVMRDGFRVMQARVLLEADWRAAYGLELIRITNEANKLGEALGKWIDPYYPTEEEFRASRTAFSKPWMGRIRTTQRAEIWAPRDLVAFQQPRKKVR